MKLGPLGVLAAALLIAAVGAKDRSISSNYLLTGHSTPLQNSLAHQFFQLAAQSNRLPSGSQNKSQALGYASRADEDDAQCIRDIYRIRDAIDNMEEWALECKHYYLEIVLILTPEFSDLFIKLNLG